MNMIDQRTTSRFPSGTRNGTRNRPRPDKVDTNSTNQATISWTNKCAQTLILFFLALCPINAPNMIPNEYGGLISPFSRPKGVLTACNGCNLLVIRLYSQTALKLPAFLGRGGWPPSFISHTYNIWDVSHCLLGLGSLPRSFYTPIWCVHLGVGPLGCMSGTKPYIRVLNQARVWFGTLG